MRVSDGPLKLLGLLACAGLLSAAQAGAATAMDSRLHSTSFHTSDGVKLHVLESCPGGADAQQARSPVIALIPGWSMPASSWREQLLALGTTHCVAALDPRGQGESELPDDGYSIERRAADIAEFVARYPRVVLVGWSLGALEALEYLHLFGDEAVEGLVLVDSSVGEEPAPPAASGTGFRERLQADREAELNNFVRAIFGATREEAEINELVQAALRLPLQDSLSLFPSDVPRTHWRDIAWAFPKPLLYAVSPQFADQARSLQRNRPETQIEIFENAGHALFADEPERFNELLVEFFATAARQAAAR